MRTTLTCLAIALAMRAAFEIAVRLMEAAR
jgi:hypothetical protein